MELPFHCLDSVYDLILNLLSFQQTKKTKQKKNEKQQKLIILFYGWFNWLNGVIRWSFKKRGAASVFLFPQSSTSCPHHPRYIIAHRSHDSCLWKGPVLSRVSHYRTTLSDHFLFSSDVVDPDCGHVWSGGGFRACGGEVWGRHRRMDWNKEYNCLLCPIALSQWLMDPQTARW